MSLLLCILHPRSCHFAGEFVSRILRWLSVFISFFIFMFSSLFFSCLAFFCEFSFTRNFSVILLTFFSNLNDYRATTRKGKLSFLVDTIFIFSVNFSAILRFFVLFYIFPRRCRKFYIFRCFCLASSKARVFKILHISISFILLFSFVFQS